MRPVVERSAVRAILLSERCEVLLLRIHAPNGETFWITPGGGREELETDELALRRELKEELGLEAFDMGPVVWRREHTFDWGDRRVCQREHYHVVHTTSFEPLMSDPVEAEWLDQFHWWSLDELRTTTDEIVPVSLVDIVDSYLTDGTPSVLPDWEILVD